MPARIAYDKVAPQGIEAMRALGNYVRHCGLKPALLELVQLRVAQINGCASCIDRLTREARAQGETEQRLYTLAVWRDTPYFSDRERAALAWAEAVTEVWRSRVEDEVYELARRHFGEKELVDLTLAVVVANSWYRLAVSFRKMPGKHSSAPSIWSELLLSDQIGGSR